MAWLVGPRLQADRDSFPPNNLLMSLAAPGLLWLGWKGFNGGDPYCASANAGAAVLNTNIATATALLVWTIMDTMSSGKRSKDAPGVSIAGWLYGNFQQFVLQIKAAAFIIVFNAIATFFILKIIPFITLLRMDDKTLRVGDHAVHGEEAYALLEG
jgi:ammonium transporter, Amt family